MMKLLLVRTSSMGDLIHTFPAITDLAQHCPDICLHWLCESSFADIAALHPFVQEVKTLSWRKWRKFLVSRETWQAIGILKKDLSAERYDAVLDAQGLWKSAVFARFAGVPVTGFNRHSARETWVASLYQNKIAVHRDANAVWRNRSLFAQTFHYEFDEKNIDFGMIEQPLFYQTPYHVALTATSADRKLWANENWLSLFQKMYETDGLPIYLPFGNETEKSRAEQLAQQYDFIHVCPKLTLKEAAALLSHASSVIGVDTGLLHLANAFNRPVIGIYTATNPEKTGVQVAANAQNIGNIGKIPTPKEVFDLWKTIIQAA